MNVTIFKMNQIIRSCIDSELSNRKTQIEADAIILNFKQIFVKTIQIATFEIMQRVLIAEVQLLKKQGRLVGSNEKEEYDYYNEVLLQNEKYVESLLLQYPEMKRLVYIQIKQLLNLFEQITESLKINQEKIQQKFCRGKSFAQVIDVEVLISDPHNGGKRAAKVMLDNGTILYYKPHSVQKNIIYQEIYQEICKKMCLLNRKIEYLDCGTHGWEEEIQQKSCETNEEVRHYYVRIGIHLCLAYILSASDLHGENLIASGEFPVIVDFETFPGMTVDRYGKNAEEKAERIIHDSVMRTGILPTLMWTKGEKTAVIGAVSNGNKIETPFRMAVVKACGTSDVHYEYEHLQKETLGCVVRLKGKTINPADYVTEISQGFQRAYELIKKEEALRLQMTKFFNQRSRVIIRHTQQYAMYRFTSLHQEIGKTLSDRRRLLSVLYEEGEDEQKHNIHTYEIQSLLNLDIPYFTIDGKSKNLFAGDGTEYSDYLPNTPYDAWKNKIDYLNESDLKRQLLMIRLSMFLLHKELPILSSGRKILDKQEDHICMVRVIHFIANEVVEQAITTPNDVTWIGPRFLNKVKWKIQTKGLYMYDGMSGIAVFFAAYLKKFPDGKIQMIFEALKEKLFAYTRQLQLRADQDAAKYKSGIWDGEGSLVYAYLLLYRITRKIEFLAYAEMHFKMVKKIAVYDSCYDYLDGNAGVIILAADLYELTGNNYYKEVAVEIEKILWTKRIQMERGCGWTTASLQIPLAGLAHGNSGFLVAYARMMYITGANSYEKKIMQLLEYEKTLYSEKEKNWIDLRPNSAKTMNAWCHGAPGILLARMELSKVMSSKQIEQDIRLAAETLFMQKPGNHVCICHGIIGNLLIMHTYLEQHDDKIYRQKYENLKHNFLTNFSEYESKIPYEILNPALMNGICGIGLGLLAIYDAENQNTDSDR